MGNFSTIHLLWLHERIADISCHLQWRTLKILIKFIRGSEPICKPITSLAKDGFQSVKRERAFRELWKYLLSVLSYHIVQILCLQPLENDLSIFGSVNIDAVLDTIYLINQRDAVCFADAASSGKSQGISLLFLSICFLFFHTDHLSLIHDETTGAILRSCLFSAIYPTVCCPDTMLFES